MATQSPFEIFLSRFSINPNLPASEAAMAKAEAQAGFTLTSSLRSCYLLTNGGEARGGPSSLEIQSLSAALGYPFFPSALGYWPFAVNNDSNPVCVCCKPPLTGYIVLVNHDDAPRLMYRSLDGFFRATVEYVKPSEDTNEDEEKYLDTHELSTDFDGPERTKADGLAARALLEMAATLEDQYQIDAYRFACDLLADEEIDAIAALLDVENEYVREHVLDRLKRIPGTNPKELLRRSAKEFDDFVEACAANLKNEKIAATIHSPYGKKTLRIDHPGPIWLNMEMFFASRKREGFAEYFMERVRSLISQRKK